MCLRQESEYVALGALFQIEGFAAGRSPRRFHFSRNSFLAVGFVLMSVVSAEPSSLFLSGGPVKIGSAPFNVDFKVRDKVDLRAC